MYCQIHPENIRTIGLAVFEYVIILLIQ